MVENNNEETKGTLEMARLMNVTRFPGGGIPNIQSMEYLAAESIVKGSVLIDDGSGQVKLAATQPTTGVVGVALEAIASKPGFEVSHDSLATVYTGRVAEVSVAIADLNTVWSAAPSTGTVAITDVNSQADIVLSGGVWRVDLSASGSAGCIIVDVDILENIVFFKWLSTVILTT